MVLHLNNHAMSMYRIVSLAAMLAASSAAAQDVWTVVPSGTTQDLRAVHFASADVGYVAGGGGTVLRTIDGGLSWQDASPDGAPDLHGIHFINLEVGVVVGDGGAIYRTLNAGIDWTPVASGVEVPLQSVSFSGNVGLAGGGSQTILRSENGGATWAIVQTDFFGGGFPGAHMLDATHGFVAGTNSIFQPLVGVSDDAGATFDFTAFYLDSNEGGLRDVHFLDAATGVVGASVWDGRGAISRTTNGGVDWTTTLFPQPIEAIDFSTATNGYAVGHIAGMLRTIDGGVSWSPTPPVISAALFDIDLPTPTLGFAVGASGTILKGSLSTAGAPAPRDGEFGLDGSFPNPVAGVMTVRFRLPSASDVTLTVYDVMGRALSNLASGRRQAGAHSVSWEAPSLPAGAYVLVLEADGRRASKVISVR